MIAHEAPRAVLGPTRAPRIFVHLELSVTK
jgi:hypothetical protein